MVYKIQPIICKWEVTTDNKETLNIQELENNKKIDYSLIMQKIRNLQSILRNMYKYVH